MEEKKKRPLTEKQKAAFERRRLKGYYEWLKGRRREIAKKKREEAKKKEKERLKKEKERKKRAEAKKKRRVGRPRKPGPKKKRRAKKIVILKKPGRKKLPPFTFKIISCKNGCQNKFIGKYRTSEEAYEVFNKLKENDKNIIFPSIITGDIHIKNSIDEYILIEKNDSKSNLLRNEYGKLVEQNLNIDGWVVIDKFKYNIEETFWVWGYENKSDRKTFLWIYENIILSDIFSSYDFKRVLIYKNKIIIKDDNNNIDIVFCKNETDAIRFYNQLEKYIKKDKIKQVVFIGDYSELNPKRKVLEDELMKLTGWTRKKVQMKTTTYYHK